VSAHYDLIAVRVGSTIDDEATDRLHHTKKDNPPGEQKMLSGVSWRSQRADAISIVSWRPTIEPGAGACIEKRWTNISNRPPKGHGGKAF
jgi:hypothetical protein